jgi:hypothetical protein
MRMVAIVSGHVMAQYSQKLSDVVQVEGPDPLPAVNWKKFIPKSP